MSDYKSYQHIVRIGDDEVEGILDPVISGEDLWTYSFAIDIAPNDTKNLSFGKYMYDLQIKYNNGLTLTVIKPSVFEIMEEVTWGN